MTSKSSDRIVRRYTNIAAIIDVLTRKQLALLDPLTWDDRNDRHFMNLYQQHVAAKKIYAACCTLSNETYHHWHVFGGSPIGAYLEFDRDRLEAHLATLKKNHDLRFGVVAYYTLETIEEREIGPDDLPFAKRWGFQAEKEYRIIVSGKDKEQTSYSIPMPINLIGRVVVNPWLPQSVYDSLRNLLRKIDGCEKLRVAKSRLIDSTRWKVAGIKIVAGEKRRRRAPQKKKKKARK